ncbi:MAG: alpha-2-macroglobulin family protein, partial [Hyphomicrobiaceae bacterium]
LISVLGDGLVKHIDVDVKKGDDEIAIDVEDGWGAGAYVIATLYHAMNVDTKRMPGRAIGVAWLAIDPTPRTLQVELDLPEKVGSGSTLTVPVHLKGLSSGESARVTIAAVDVGILNLTRFKSPAPESWFYAQRLLGSEYRDFYGRLIDGMRAERGALKFGGDGGGGGVQGNPPVEETVSLFSGIVKVDDQGRAKVSFDLPEFNGTVRIMAVAWSAGKVGHKAKSVIVRDPIAVTASGPRFMTLGDEARLQLDLHNVEGAAADYSVSVVRSYQSEASGSTAGETVFQKSHTLAIGARQSLQLTMVPKHIGFVTYAVRVSGPNGIDVGRELLFSVKPPARGIKRVTVSSLKPSGGKITISKDLLVDMIPGHASVSLSVGPLASYNVPLLLNQLDRYPYGCAEQTTSRALPLLYANALAVRSGSRSDAAIREKIAKAIARLFAMQDSSGAFGAWGPGAPDLWLTAYVTDFLSRAREAGYSFDKRKFGQALNRLRNFISYASDFKKGGENRAYALYVLARNGQAPIGDLRYYADTRLDRFATPLAKAQIGAALAMMGDKPRAQNAFRAAIAELGDLQATGGRVDYGSGLRDGAAVLTLASETQFVAAEAAGLSDVLSRAFASRTQTSTQEQAWLLLAANALGNRGNDTRLTVNGRAHSGLLRRTLSPAELSHGELTIANSGEEAVDVLVSVIGAALTPEPAIEKGFKIERSYYKLDGTPVELASATGGQAQIGQSDRMVVVVKVTAEDKGGRVLLVDRLPAGLEIENPRLVGSGDVKALPWLKSDVHPEHTEFRDDRFVAAFDFFQQKGKYRSATVAYVVRAVTPGSFVHPAAIVEDMYRPERFARTAAGRLTIKAQP